MEHKVNAIVLRAVDFNENDKMLTLLTAEKGKIVCGIKGVKKAGAKLKFAAQPFCFAEYVLARRGERYTVVNAAEAESFYDLRTDINKFYAASSALEAACALTYEGDECPEIFRALVCALTGMCTENESEKLIDFLLFILKKSGYGIFAETCPKCGANLADKERLRFDMATGSFVCSGCGGIGASRVTYNQIRKSYGKSYDAAHITADGEKRALRLIREYAAYKLGLSFKSLSEYVRLI